MSEDVSEARKRITSMRSRLGSNSLTRPGTPQLSFSRSSPDAALWNELLAALDDIEKRLAELERKAAQ
jgi:hypothetical protein